jgi:hypothetical protein
MARSHQTITTTTATITFLATTLPPPTTWTTLDRLPIPRYKTYWSTAPSRTATRFLHCQASRVAARPSLPPSAIPSSALTTQLRILPTSPRFMSTVPSTWHLHGTTQHYHHTATIQAWGCLASLSLALVVIIVPTTHRETSRFDRRRAVTRTLITTLQLPRPPPGAQRCLCHIWTTQTFAQPLCLERNPFREPLWLPEPLTTPISTP